MSSHRHSPMLVWSLVAIGGLIPLRTHAATGTQFLARRKALHCDRKITFAEVTQTPMAYTGRVIELRGTVGGKVGAEGHLSVMLNLEDQHAVMLDVPADDLAEVADLATPQIRALVQVQESGIGNVVPLKTLMIVRESAVATQEQIEEARREAERKRAELRLRERQRWQATVDRALHRRSPDQYASRGEFNRTLPQGVVSFPGLGPRVQPLYPAYLRFICARNSRLTGAQASQITYHLLNFADRYNVDPRLVVAMIIAESDFDPASTSHTGAKGLGQLMPGTARELGVNNPYDIVQNLGGSISYLRTRLDTFADPKQMNGGYTFQQVALAMAAYNAGENAVKRYRGVPPYRETQAYVKRVTTIYQQLCR